MAVELVCPFCRFSKRISEKKIPPKAKWAICPNCRQKFEISMTDREPAPVKEDIPRENGTHSAGQETSTGAVRIGAPWEERSGKGFGWRLYQTFKSALFTPGAFFRGLSFREGLREPLAFGLLVGSIGNMFGVFWPVMMMSGGLFPFGAEFLVELGGGLIFLVLIMVIPICVTIGMFVYSAVLHLLLLIVRGGPNGFEATFRVVAYSQAAQLWELVPVIGSWVGGVWQLVVQVIGLREIHKVSYSRVIVVFLLPLFLLSALIVAVVIPLFVYLTR